MDSLKVSDDQSKAVQKTPNRVALDDIESNIALEFYVNGGDAARAYCPYVPREGGPTNREVAESLYSLEVLTICLIVLKNGFSVIGKSAPADPGNFNAEVGRKFAREDAIRQIWPLMGFALRTRLHEGW